MATAAPHHGQAFGSLVVIDPQVADDDGMGPVKRLTPEVGFPESQGGREVYGTAWPLSEDYYLCVYDAADGSSHRHPASSGQPTASTWWTVFGNKELIYRDPAIGCLSPIPLRPHHPAARGRRGQPGGCPERVGQPGHRGGYNGADQRL